MKIKKELYTYDSYGSASELVIITTDLDSNNLFASYRKVLNEVQKVIDRNSHDERIYSAYDCTGKPFGSRWRLLDRVVGSDKDHVSFVYIHSWAIDV